MSEPLYSLRLFIRWKSSSLKTDMGAVPFEEKTKKVSNE